MAKRRMKLSTPSEIRTALSKVANSVINGEIDNKTASTFTYVTNGILQSIRTDEQERRLQELEQYVEHIKENK